MNIRGGTFALSCKQHPHALLGPDAAGDLIISPRCPRKLVLRRLAALNAGGSLQKLGHSLGRFTGCSGQLRVTGPQTASQFTIGGSSSSNTQNTRCVCCFLLLLLCFVVFVLLCFVDPILGNLTVRGHSFSQGTWGCRILTLHLNHVAGYTVPLLFLFERTHNYSVDNQGLLPWWLRRLGESIVRSDSSVRCVPGSNQQTRGKPDL